MTQPITGPASATGDRARLDQCVSEVLGEASLRMATKRQDLGNFDEQRVTQDCSCPRCKRSRTLVRLPPNFKCADLICDFCGYLAQVKASIVSNLDVVPSKVLGAAWGPQKARMEAAIYFPLFLVLVKDGGREYAIYFLSADLQKPEMFVPRAPLSASARRAGWQGFIYNLDDFKNRFVRLR